MKKILIFNFLLGFLFFGFNASAEDYTVTITETGYTPKSLNIGVGDRVLFYNSDIVDHWPASNIHPTHDIYPEFDPKKSIAPDKTWIFTFGKPGIWKYHDHLYPKLAGTITVIEDDSASKDKDLGFTQKITSGIKSFFEKIFNAIRGALQRKTSLNQGSAILKAISKDSIEIFSNEEALKAYVQKFGPKETLAQLSFLSSQYGSCHEAAHKAGRMSYEFFGDASFKECGSECHSGCYHGATEAYFKENGTDNLSEKLETLCGSELNSFFSHQCIHGIGHGLMAWSNYDLHEALNACDLLPERQDSCWTGVFMENIVGGLTDKTSEHFTEYLSDDPHYPCNSVAEKYKGSCYFLQTSRMVQLFNANFSKIAKSCSEAPGDYRHECFLSMGRDAGGINRKNPAGSIAACSNAPDKDSKIFCLNGAIQDSFWDSSGQDDAVNFCKLLSDKQEKGYCYSLILSRAADILSSQSELNAFCGKFEDSYRKLCGS